MSITCVSSYPNACNGPTSFYLCVCLCHIYIYISGVGRCQKVGGTQTRDLSTFGKEPI